MGDFSPGLLIAGGGTGGHVLAGVALAESWRAKFPDSEILFVGSVGGMEEKLVPRAGFKLEVLSIGALKGKSRTKKVKTILQLPFAFWFSAYILLRLKPKAILGVGGYSSGPPVLMARLIGWLWGAQVAILEQNSVPGFTNKILGYFSHKVFTAFVCANGSFPVSKTTVSGNPTRRGMQFLSSAPRQPLVVFIFGGSQGAQAINSLVIEALSWLSDLKEGLRFIHQTGNQDFVRVSEGYKKAGFLNLCQIEKFIDDMVSSYQKASLLVCRAGASTLSEVAAVGRASILIPFPFATDNHQEKNAKIFEKAGAALLLDPLKAQGKDLAELIRNCLHHPSRLAEMEKRAHALFTPDASKIILESLLNS